MILVDTSAWYALMDRSCVEHEVATKFAASAGNRFVTTDYILSETLTLLRARGLNDAAYKIGEALLTGGPAQLVWVTPSDVHSALVLFQYRDKAWSFVDCVSFAVAQRLGIDDAFAFDDHFRQIGTLNVNP